MKCNYVTVSGRQAYLDVDTDVENHRLVKARVPHSLDDAQDFDECLGEVGEAMF